MAYKNILPKNKSNRLGSFGMVAIVLLFMFVFVGPVPASAHTTVEAENIEIDAGWGIEPPIVGQK